MRAFFSVVIGVEPSETSLRWRVVWPFPLLPFFYYITPVPTPTPTLTQQEKDMAYSSYLIKSHKAEIARKKTKLAGLQSKKKVIDDEITVVEGEIAHLVTVVTEAEKEAAPKA